MGNKRLGRRKLKKKADSCISEQSKMAGKKGKSVKIKEEIKEDVQQFIKQEIHKEVQIKQEIVDDNYVKLEISNETDPLADVDELSDPTNDSTFKINLLFLQSMNPSLDKMDIIDTLTRCDMNVLKAGRILRTLSDEKKKKSSSVKTKKKQKKGVNEEVNDKERVEYQVKNNNRRDYRRIEVLPHDTPIETDNETLLEYRMEQKFAKMCRTFPRRDRLFIQNCLVLAKWDERSATAMIRAGPGSFIKETTAPN